MLSALKIDHYKTALFLQCDSMFAFLQSTASCTPLPVLSAMEVGSGKRGMGQLQRAGTGGVSYGRSGHPSSLSLLLTSDF